MNARLTKRSSAGCRVILFLSSAILVLSSSIFVQAQSPEIRRSYDFRQGALSWQADFVGYTQYNQDIYDLVAEIRALPPELGVAGNGYYLQSKNVCDCMVMFLKRRLDVSEGVVAGQTYQVSYTVTLASNAQTGCPGAGGAPGEAVRLLFGGSQIQPVTFTGPYDTRRLNVESTVASLAGNIANGQPCNPSSKPYVTIERSGQHSSQITASPAGELWMFVGTGSGFEGLTGLYYQRIDVTLTPMGKVQPPPVDPPVLITEEGAGNVLALNALTFVRDPFPFYTRGFSNTDITQVMLFARNSALATGETASAITVFAEDERGVVFQLPIVSVSQVPNLDWLTQIAVRLPNELQDAKNVRVSFNLHGVNTAKAGINLVSPF